MSAQDKSCCQPREGGQALPVNEREANETLARLAKALGHPIRVAIIRLLLRRETCVCGEIVGQLPVAQSTVSQHLKILKETGFIQGEVDGARTCYCVRPDTVTLLKTLIGRL